MIHNLELVQLNRRNAEYMCALVKNVENRTDAAQMRWPA